jgi:hypothetical protein
VRRSIRPELLVWSVLVLPGCVLIDREVKLAYPPAPEEGQPSEPPSRAPAPDAPAVQLAVTDSRPEPRSDLGPVRNAYGMQMATVKTHDDVVAWVTAALLAELQRAGLRVTTPSSTSADLVAAPVLNVEVQKVYCDAYFSYGADVTLASRVLLSGGSSWTGTFPGQGGAGTNWTATEASFSLSLSRALQAATKALATNLNAWLVSQRPPPTVPEPRPGPAPGT